MRILSSEVQQVFRAYARQLRSDYAKGQDAQVRETRAKGFEKVEISDEAKALAASLPETVQRQVATEKPGKAYTKKENSTDDSESNEKASEPAKDEPGDSRSKNVEN